eukprot:520263_1
MITNDPFAQYLHKKPTIPHRLLLLVSGFIRMRIYEKNIPLRVPDSIQEFCSHFVWKLEIDSICLTKKEKGSFLRNISQKFSNLYVNFQLLYRASKDGFDSYIFRQECAGQGATITLILNQYNHIFGGYTSKSYTNGANVEYIKDENAFLFVIRSPKLKQPKMIKLKKGGSSTAIFNNYSFGPYFGGGDIIVQKNKGFCSPHSFQIYDKKEFCGSRLGSFSIDDYEVFAVQFV